MRVELSSFLHLIEFSSAFTPSGSQNLSGFLFIIFISINGINSLILTSQAVFGQEQLHVLERLLNWVLWLNSWVFHEVSGIETFLRHHILREAGTHCLRQSVKLQVPLGPSQTNCTITFRHPRAVEEDPTTSLLWKLHPGLPGTAVEALA